MSDIGRALTQLLGQVGIGLLGEGLGNLAGGGFRGGVVRIGSILLGVVGLSGLLRPPAEDETDAGTLSGSQNTARPYGHVPRIYGKTRIIPDLAATPVTDIEGNVPYLRLLLCCGYAPLRLSEFQFGDRAIGQPTAGRNAAGRPAGTVDGVQMQVSSGWGAQQDDLTLFNSRVVEQHLDKPLEYAPAWSSRGQGIRGTALNNNVIRLISADNAVRLGLDLLFPDGLMNQDGSDITGERVDLSVRYRPYGSTTTAAWTYLVPDDVITAATAEVLTWTDGDVFGWLTETNAQLTSIIADLTNVSEGSRYVSNFFRSWLIVSLGRNSAISTTLLADEDLDAGQIAQLTAFQGHLNSIETLLDTAADVTGDLADGAQEFNDLLSGVIRVIEFADSLVRLDLYIRQGVGPDLSTLSNVQRLLVQWRNASHLFGEAPTGSFIIANLDADPGQLWRGLSWEVTPGKYEVQVRRTSESHSTRTERDQSWWDSIRGIQGEVITVTTGIKDALHVWGFKTWLDEPAVSAEALSKYAFVAVRIKASEIWNGSVPRISCLAEAPIPHYSGGAWQPAALGTTYRNPAWIFAAILRATENPSPVDDSQLDIARLAEWATFCAALAYWFDYSCDQGRSVLDTLSAVARAGRGSPTVRDGLYSVVYDHYQDPVALVALRNTSRFQSVKSFAELPHGIRIGFKNAEENYADDEVIVYRSGYGPSGASATLLESTTLPGVTARAHAEALGKYIVRVAELRPEVITFDMDWEHQLFERGDWISVQHDVVLWGLGSARIKSGITLSGGRLVSCVLDEQVTLDTAKTYQMKIRTADNVLHTGNLTSTAGPTATVTFSPYVNLGASTVAVGDLVAWGQRRIETIDCIVAEIRPRPEQRASIRCVQASPSVFDLEADAVYTPGISTPVRPELTRPHAPVISMVKTDESVLYHDPGGNVSARIVLSVLTLMEVAGARQRATNLVDAIELQYRLIGYRPVVDGRLSTRSVFTVDGGGALPPWRSMPLFRPHETIYFGPAQTGQYYDLRVRAITTYGIPSEWTTRSRILVVGKSTPPKDVEAASYLNGVISWRYDNPPLDLAGFRVRVIHGQGGNWETALPAHEGVLRQNSFSLGADFGKRVYFIKAVDTSGLESHLAARVAVDLGGPPWNGLLSNRDHAAASWTGIGTGGYDTSIDPLRNGVIEGASIDGGKLKQDAGSITEFYRFGSGIYRASSAPLYHTDYLAMTYEWTFVPVLPVDPTVMPSYGIVVEVDADSGDDYALEYKHNFGDIWPDDLQRNIWPPHLSENVWPEQFEQWRPAFGAISYAFWQWITLTAPNLRFRLSAPAGNTQVVINTIKESLKVIILEEYVDSFAVAATGTVRLPITKAFTEIQSVTLTLEYSAGTASAVMAKVLDRYVDLGPSIAVYDSSGARVAGIVDARIQGY